MYRRSFNQGGEVLNKTDSLEIVDIPVEDVDDTQNLLSQHSNVPFVDRINNPRNYPYPDENKDGTISTHLLSAEVDETGQAYVFPTKVYQDDEYKTYSKDDRFESLDIAKKSGNVIKFDTIEAANKFSKNYKTDDFNAYYDMGWFRRTFEGTGDNIVDQFDILGKRALNYYEDVKQQRADNFNSLRLKNPYSTEGLTDLGVSLHSFNKQESDAEVAQRNEEIKVLEQQMQERTPENLTLTQQGLRSTVQSAPTTAVAMLSTLVTRNPTVGLSIMGATTGVDSYGEARETGKTIGESLVYGSVQGTIEAWTERLGLKPLLKMFKKSGTSKQFLEYLTKEIAGEQIATFGQSMVSWGAGLDEALGNPNLSAEDKVILQAERQYVTLIATAAMSGTTGTGKATIVGGKKIHESLKSDERKLADEMQKNIDGSVLDVDKFSTDALSVPQDIIPQTTEDFATLETSSTQPMGKTTNPYPTKADDGVIGELKPVVGFHMSPHKFDTVDPAKQQEGLMGKGHYIFLDEKAAADYPGAYKYTQEVPADIGNRVINFGDGKDSEIVIKAFETISNKLGLEFTDDFRPNNYFELIDAVGPNTAHELLKEQGVIGNTMDIGTTSKPAAIMMYSTEDIKLLTRNDEVLNTTQADAGPLFQTADIFPDSQVKEVQFHGTKEEYETFGFNTSGYADPGWHFGSEESARNRTTQLDEEEGQWRSKPNKPVKSPKGHKLIKVHLNITNPLRLYEEARPFGGSWNIHQVVKGIFEPQELPPGFTEKDRDEYYDLYLSAKVTDEYTGELIDVPIELNKDETSPEVSVLDLSVPQQTEWINNFLKAHGYDGIVYDNAYEKGGDSYAVFDSSQIVIEDAIRYEDARAEESGFLNTEEAVEEARKIPFFNALPISNVKNLINSETGKPAWGSYYKGLVTFVENPHETTLPHEVFHAFSDLVLTKKKRTQMHNAVRLRDGTLNPDWKSVDIGAEETLAEEFATWFTSGKAPKTVIEKAFRVIKNKMLEFTGAVKDSNSKLGYKFNDNSTKQQAKIDNLFIKVMNPKLAKQKVTSKSPEIVEARENYQSNPRQFTTKTIQFLDGLPTNSEGLIKKATLVNELGRNVSKQNIKLAERKLYELVLDSEEFKDQSFIDINEFTKALEKELLDVKIIHTNRWAQYGLRNIGLDTDGVSRGHHSSKLYTENDTTRSGTIILDSESRHGITGPERTGVNHFEDVYSSDMNTGGSTMVNYDGELIVYPELDPNGRPEKEIKVPRSGMLSHVRWAIGADGNFYVTEMQSDVIQMLYHFDKKEGLNNSEWFIERVALDVKTRKDAARKKNDRLRVWQDKHKNDSDLPEDFTDLPEDFTDEELMNSVTDWELENEQFEERLNEEYNIELPALMLRAHIAREFEGTKGDIEVFNNIKQIADFVNDTSPDQPELRSYLRQTFPGKFYINKIGNLAPTNVEMWWTESLANNNNYLYNSGDGNELTFKFYKDLLEAIDMPINASLPGDGNRDMKSLVNNLLTKQVDIYVRGEGPSDKVTTLSEILNETEENVRLRSIELEEALHAPITKEEEEAIKKSQRFLEFGKGEAVFELNVKTAINFAANKGESQVRFPTAKTLSTIEGWYTPENSNNAPAGAYSDGSLEIGDEVESHLGIPGIVTGFTSEGFRMVMLGEREGTSEGVQKRPLTEQLMLDIDMVVKDLEAIHTSTSSGNYHQSGVDYVFLLYQDELDKAINDTPAFIKSLDSNPFVTSHDVPPGDFPNRAELKLQSKILSYVLDDIYSTEEAHQQQGLRTRLTLYEMVKVPNQPPIIITSPEGYPIQAAMENWKVSPPDDRFDIEQLPSKVRGIAKRYHKVTLPYLKKLRKQKGGVAVVRDENGHTWYEIDIQPYDKGAVEMYQSQTKNFRRGGLVTQMKALSLND